MSKALKTGLAALAACAMFGCLGGGMVVDDSEAPTSDTSATEPTLLAGDNSGSPTAEDPRVADERGDLASANGATARSITHNHPQPHGLVIPALDLSSGRGGVFTLTHGGGAYDQTHTHDVSLTAQQLGELRDGAQLDVETTAGGTGGGHTHTVTIARR